MATREIMAAAATVFICIPVSTPEKVDSLGYIDGLVQERRNSSALAIEIRLSYTNPSIC